MRVTWKSNRGRVSARVKTGLGNALVVPGSRCWDMRKYPIQDGDIWEVEVDGKSIREEGVMIFARPVRFIENERDEIKRIRGKQEDKSAKEEALLNFAKEHGLAKKCYSSLYDSLRYGFIEATEESVLAWMDEYSDRRG